MRMIVSPGLCIGVKEAASHHTHEKEYAPKALRKLTSNLPLLVVSGSTLS